MLENVADINFLARAMGNLKVELEQVKLKILGDLSWRKLTITTTICDNDDVTQLLENANEATDLQNHKRK